MSISTVIVGQLAEENACQFLETQGLTLVEKNFAVHHVGEIDLIMRDHDYYVFIEVKTRQNLNYGKPIEVVAPAKKYKIIRTASLYLLQQGLWDTVYSRFDVVGISSEKNNSLARKITWIKNAFEVEY